MYLPHPKPQIGDPTTTLDGYVCTMESAAVALDFHTGGRINVWGGQLVPYCGKTIAQIKDRGTNLIDAQRAWAHWGQSFTNLTGQAWLRAESELNKGNIVLLQGDYDQFNLAERCQDNFLGTHAIVVLPRKSGYSWLTYDPLCKTFKYISSTDLRRFAEKLGRAKLGTNEVRQPIFFGSATPKLAAPKPYSAEVALNVVKELPGLIADIGAGTLYNDPDRHSIRVRRWPGAKNVGVYARAHPRRLADGRSGLSMIRVTGTNGTNPTAAYVGDNLLSNLRVVR